LTADADPKMYEEMNPASETKNKSPNIALVRPSIISPAVAPTKMSASARAGATQEFNWHNT